MPVSTRGQTATRLRALTHAAANNGANRSRSSLLLFLICLLTANVSTARAADTNDADIPAAASVLANEKPSDAVATDSPHKPANSRRVRLGASVRGTPIEMEIFGDGPDTIMFVGGIHGDEPNGTALAERLARFLRENPELLEGRTVGVLPRANPDGLADGTRANSNGVDLNRNFPTSDWRKSTGGLSHGSRPASEPETRAVVAAVKMIKPRRFVDIHSIPAGYQCNNYDGSAGPLAKLMSSLNGYPATADIGYSTPGALGCWAGIDLQIPAITLELPRGAESARCWRENAVALLAAINASEDRLTLSASASIGSR